MLFSRLCDEGSVRWSTPCPTKKGNRRLCRYWRQGVVQHNNLEKIAESSHDIIQVDYKPCGMYWITLDGMQRTCRWLATFSRVMPSTFISCSRVFGTACFTPCGEGGKGSRF